MFRLHKAPEMTELVVTGVVMFVVCVILIKMIF